MNHYIKLLCKSIALKNDLSESQVLERAVMLLAAGLEPERDEYPAWYQILANAPRERLKDMLLELLDESAGWYIADMEGEDDNRDDDL